MADTASAAAAALRHQYDASQMSSYYMDYLESVVETFERGYIVSFFSNEDEKECGRSWALIPGLTAYPSSVQAGLYTVVLVYLFLGIAIISDIFMSSVEGTQKSRLPLDPAYHRLMMMNI